MAVCEFSDTQAEAIQLSREIVAFADANRFNPSDESIADFKQKLGEDARLVYRDRHGRWAASAEGTPGAPSVALFFDNVAWVKRLAEDYAQKFSARVEAVRLKFVAAGVIPEYELWYTKHFMTEARIRMLASFLICAAFSIERIGLSPSTSITEFPDPGPTVGIAEALRVG